MKVDVGRQIVRAALTAAIFAPIFVSGCADKCVQVWTPKPLVRWDHLFTQPAYPVRDGYRVLVPQPTHGLFPAAMAVTRVALDDTDEQVRAPRLYLLTDPRNEFLQWNSALDDQMAVSEVFPIVERDLGGSEARPEQVLAAFRALHARLGLAYAVNELNSTVTEMFGVLYNTTTAQPIASLHASAVSVVPPEGQDNDESADLWETDSRALVRAKFEHLVHTCIRELIQQDRPPPIESPTGWTPAGPIRPAEWPPRHFRTGP